MARLRKYNYSFQIKELFKNPVLKDFSKHIETISINNTLDALEGEVKLTPIQKWFFSKNYENDNYWNQSMMIESKYMLDQEIIKKIFDKIIIHHDILRAVFEKKEGVVKQYIRGIDKKLYSLDIFDFRGIDEFRNSITIECDKIQRSINLSKGPLVKLGLFKTDHMNYVIIVIHHLVIDVVSWRILSEDFVQAYNQCIRGEEIVLESKTTSYMEWANALSNYDVLKEIEYWQSIENTNVNMLPKDFNNKNEGKKGLQKIVLSLSNEKTEFLLKHTNKILKCEINHILLTALGLTIKKWTRKSKILITLEGHGREQVFNDFDISRTIGWFTSQYPVIIDVGDSEDIYTVIQNIKENLNHIPNNGFGYQVIRYLEDEKFQNNLKFKREPQICFNYLGQVDNDIPQDNFNLSTIYEGKSSDEYGSSYCLDISAIVIDGCYNIAIQYYKSEYYEKTILNIAESYLQYLEDILSYAENLADSGI